MVRMAAAACHYSDIGTMHLHVVGNVIYLHRRGRRRTHCLDCDPAADRPLDLTVRADPRTGEILTPCPSCGNSALVDLPGAGARASGGDDA